MKTTFLSVLALILSFCTYEFTFAHCDTMDGPVIADAKKAIEQNNVNYILKWVSVENEQKIKTAFDVAMKVRKSNPASTESTDRYLFETLVRLHRNGEGVEYTGIKPSGTPIDEKIRAADKSIELGNLSPLEKLVPNVVLPELKERFDRVMSLKNFDVNDVKAGREYVKAYVQFFHFAEGERAHGHEQREHLGHLPWIILGIISIVLLTLGILYSRNK